MPEFKILLVSEGKHEVGGFPDEAIIGFEKYALPMLVHRLLGKPKCVQFHCRYLKDVGLIQRNDLLRTLNGARVHGYTRKVAQAVADARIRGFDAVVIVADRDRETDRQKALTDGRDQLKGNYLPSAVGCAVEAFDAWMIADGRAIKLACGNPAIAYPAPESLDGEEGTGRHPKERAAEIFGTGVGLGAKYAAVAADVDLDLLAKACKKGFAPFAKEVVERIAPHLPKEVKE